MTTDTIVALSTAVGRGALAIVRLSGPGAIAIAGRAFRPRARLVELATRSCAVGHLVDGDERIDQVVATVFRAPETYTGEDLVELTCHGGLAVPARVTQLLQKVGARPAQPGEFTQRAFLHGRIDLSQAEAVAALINARSGAAARLAMRVLEGGLRRALDPTLRRLTQTRALLESTLDIQEDGSPDVLTSIESTIASPSVPPAEAITEVLEEEMRRLERLLAGARGGQLLEDGIRVAIVGSPNAGKSSLFNALLSRERAIVSPTPGTTRDFLEGWVEWAGLPIVLVDTAGLQTPGAEVEAQAMRRTREVLASSSVVVHVADVAATTPREAREMERELVIEGRGLIRALHKWELGASAAWRDELAAAESAVGVTTVASSIRGEPGVDGLRLAIMGCADAQAGDIAAALALGGRQRALLGDARDALARGRALAAEQAGDELVAFEIQAGALALGQILGRRVGPEMLSEIFSRFCVGK